MTYATDTTNAVNRQTSEYVPLITLRLPDGFTDVEGRSEFHFQLNDSTPITDDGITYYFISGFIDNISGSMIPYSPYKYTIHLANNSISSTVTTDVASSDLLLQSLLDFINANDGLRNCTVDIKYNHRNTPELNTTGKYRIDRCILATEKIVIEMIATLSNNIPAICV